MKARYAPFIFSLIAAGGLRGQIPNSGFEEWTTHGDHMDPVGWWCTNDSVSGGGWFPVERVSEHWPLDVGSYAMLIKNNTALLPSWGGIGISWTGDFSGSDYPVFPVTGHPDTLWGWYRFSPQNGDTMEVHIRLYQNGVDVGGGQYKTADATAGWELFHADISDYATADSARIMVLACYDNDGPVPHGNSALWIDNLSFDTPVTGILESGAPNGITVFPNPASGWFDVRAENAFPPGTVLELCDLLGRQWSRVPLRGTALTRVDVANVPPGTYLLKRIGGAGVSVRRIVVSR